MASDVALERLWTEGDALDKLLSTLGLYNETEDSMVATQKRRNRRFGG